MSAESAESAEEKPAVQSLRELVDLVTGRNFRAPEIEEDAGLAEVLPFPFLGLVGQQEMKQALLIAMINPMVSGVLLVGPRGTGKTTIVRSLIDLLPTVQRSTCYYGCLPEDIETGGMSAVCPDCAKKYGQGLPLTRLEKARLVELPLNARLDDVIGCLEEEPGGARSFHIKSGILKQADQNVLYVDEVNLIADEISNAILDASALGTYTVRRGALAQTYRARFTLIGSMNPEEGSLRPQMMDRFGLRVISRGLPHSEDRLEAYARARAFRQNPRQVALQYAADTCQAQAEIQAARERLPATEIPADVLSAGVAVIQELGIDSLRADLTLFEAARAFAAADGRLLVTTDDLRAVAPMALRLRQSPFMIKYFQSQDGEEQKLQSVLNTLIPASKEGTRGEGDQRSTIQ